MKNILVLDCTLRDGGYCNQWCFQEANIKKIVSGLIAAKVDIVECGFLTNTVSYKPDVSKYTEVMQLFDFIPQHDESEKFVVMMNYGEYDVDKLPEMQEAPIDGIRVAFHKKDRYQALDLCKKIAEKGYLVFLQPMVTMLYSEKEFVELILAANQVKPYAFYIVDSFGMMTKKSLDRFVDLVEKYLENTICMGFHSHNNLQLAFMNAQSLLERNSSRELIVDTSIYGMGRGAGNLNSELFLNELNVDLGKKYDVKPILKLMDEVLNRFYEENPWGYSLPNYLSAVHMIHPNYAGYLSEKKTLTVDDIDEIFSMMDPERGAEYDKKYIEHLYIQYMSAGVARSEHLAEIKERMIDKKILLIAPGRSALKEKDLILQFIRENNPIVISINHNYPLYDVDFLFVSNIRRFHSLDKNLYGKTISTSNIKTMETFASIDYYNLLNSIEMVRDNAGLMAINFVLQELEKKEVYIAGLDGYSHDLYANFETPEMAFIVSENFLEKTNSGIRMVLLELSKSIKIEFITSSIFKS